MLTIHVLSTDVIKLSKMDNQCKETSEKEWSDLKRTVDICSRVLQAPSAEPSQTVSSHVMLSYNWSTKPLVQKLKAKLLAAGLLTWMDEDDI